ncbi:MAG: T9SS type A sorting domain-containing protein [Saprospiraceae bacterium]|nr:T9SS type A sorting domain-containing protein [Saprospiraceae bacterium]
MTLLPGDQSNGHGLGANYLGLAASAASGIDPRLTNGFNIEGLVMAPNSPTVAYVAFRAPIVPPANRTEALIIPVNNFSSLLGAGAGSATFDAPIFLDLGGRGIRSIEKSGFNEYLIIAGPAGLTGAAPNNFVLYRWDGVPGDPALPINNDLSVPVNETGGSFETIIGVPNTASVGRTINLMLDNGDTQWYGNGIINKELGQSNYKKCQQYQISLGATDFCALATPINCGINYTGNNNTGKYYFNKWATALETTGPELIYKIETTSVGAITVNLLGLSADLDILLLNSCLDNSLIGASQAGGSSNEFISIANAPAGTYYIVIDGFNGATSNFSLNVACTNCSIVTNTNDSGVGSLREAVACTPAGGTIIFDAAINGLPIKLTSGEININKNLTFKGNGQSNTIIDGSMDVGNNSRLFNINNNAAVEFRDMTFQHGGGVNSNEQGAAMVIANETSVVATVNCKFSNNTTSNIGGAIMIFGGVFKSFNSIYNNNSSSGGIFWNQGTGQIDLVQCAIFNNSTSGATNVLVSFSLANIIQCTIAGNSGNRAIENQGTITFSNNIITDNNGIALLSTGITAASNNLLDNPGDLITLIGINGNIQGSADFVNLAAGDLRLLITSDALNKGDQNLLPIDIFDIDNDGNTTEVLSVDLAGDARVFNTNVEMGAYENDDPCSIILAQAETVSECMDGAYDLFLNVEIANGGSNYIVTRQTGGPVNVPSGLAVIFTDQVGIQNFLIVDGSNPGCSAFAASSPPSGCGTLCSEANLTLGNFGLPSNSYSASQTITSSSIIESGADVEFLAGTSIKLSPGFHAEAGATFSAKIEACTPPSVPAAIATIPSDVIITNSNIALTIQPNPAQYQTTLVFNLSEAASTYLEVYSSAGVRVKTLLNNSWMEAGNYTQDLTTDELQSGMYLVVLRTDSQVVTQKLMVLE